MKIKIFGRIFPAFGIGLALLGWATLAQAAAPAAPAVPRAVSMGDNTYSITCEANYIFARNTGKLKAQATEAAVKFCASQGKQLKVLSLTEEKPFWGVDFIKAKIVFKALDAGDPELLVSEPVNGKPAAAGDLYADLLKLDDLRKKGILTDDEFAAEKKKILKRSK